MADDAKPALTTALCATLQGIGGGLGWSLLPPLMPTIAEELGISHAIGGVVWGAAPLGIALASPFGGAAVDRFGARRVAGVAMLVGALACASRALANGPLALAVMMFLFGLHIGFVAPAIPKALAGHVPLARLGRANGLALLAYTVGTAVTMLTARTVLAPAFGGWRGAMEAAGAAMALAGALWLALLKDRVALSRHASIRDVLELTQHPGLRRVAAMHFLLFGGYLALLGLLFRALVETGVAPARAALAVAGWLLAAAVGNFLGPQWSDRLGLRKPFIIGGSLVAGTALGLLAIQPSGGSLFLLGLMALGGGAFAPLLLALPLELPYIGAPRVGAALGLLMLVGQAGGFVLPVIVGVAAQHGGFSLALVVLAAVHLLILIPGLRLAETGRRAARPAAQVDFGGAAA
ncbi:MAG: MFS transporter [Myxococcota bacterium]